MSRTLRIGCTSLAISILVLGLKAVACWLTGSVALYSDALQTVISVAALLATLLAIWVSERPTDATHPYGHYKAEYLSAIIEGSLVLATSALIAREAWLTWEHPHAPRTPVLGVALNGGAVLINLCWATGLIRLGKRLKSPALLAGGKHIMTDVWTTGGVLGGFTLVPLTGWLRLDPAVAVLVAANILWGGYAILRESVGGLMQEVSDPKDVFEVRQLISQYAEGAIEAHGVGTRRAGSMTFIEFHLVVPAKMTVEEANAMCDRVKGAIRDHVGQAIINIHLEPEKEAKQHAVLRLV